MADLINPTELATHLRRVLQPDSALSACRVASGWLRSATGLTAWPSPVPDDLWGWALELAALIYVNPEGLDRSMLGRMLQSWGPELLRRRELILKAARAAYGTGTAGGPVGSFPAAEAWPDPAWPTVTA